MFFKFDFHMLYNLLVQVKRNIHFTFWKLFSIFCYFMNLQIPLGYQVLTRQARLAWNWMDRLYFTLLPKTFDPKSSLFKV